MDESMNLPQEKPSDTQSNETLDPADAIRRKYNNFNLQLFVEMGEQRVSTENFEKRMQSLRKSAETHLKATEWQYVPIEKYIGQA